MTCNEIHTLKIAYFSVSFDEADQNVPQLAVKLRLNISIFDIWKSPQHIFLDLLKIGVRIEQVFTVLQLLIVTWVSMRLA